MQFSPLFSLNTEAFCRSAGQGRAQEKKGPDPEKYIAEAPEVPLGPALQKGY